MRSETGVAVPFQSAWALSKKAFYDKVNGYTTILLISPSMACLPASGMNRFLRTLYNPCKFSTYSSVYGMIYKTAKEAFFYKRGQGTKYV